MVLPTTSRKARTCHATRNLALASLAVAVDDYSLMRQSVSGDVSNDDIWVTVFLLQRAASLSGRTLGEFGVASAREAAAKVIHTLSAAHIESS